MSFRGRPLLLEPEEFDLQAEEARLLALKRDADRQVVATTARTPSQRALRRRLRPCAECGAIFSRPSSGKPAKYCQRRCKRKAECKRLVEQRRAANIRRAAREKAARAMARAQ